MGLPQAGLLSGWIFDCRYSGKSLLLPTSSNQILTSIFQVITFEDEPDKRLKRPVEESHLIKFNSLDIIFNVENF